MQALVPVTNEGVNADDGAQLSGSVLTRGTYLIEIEFARPVPQVALLDVLERWTFRDVILDQSVRPDSSVLGSRRYRFVAKIEDPIEIRDTPMVRWIYVHLSPLDLHSEPADRIPIKPFRLEAKKTYALRFLSRMKAQKTREEVCELLAYMGFAPSKVTGLRRNMRIAGRPNVSMTRWYGLGEWQKANSYVVEEHPFIFEDVIPIEVQAEAKETP